MSPIVIYHGNCADGFTAAWLANIHFHCETQGHVDVPTDWVVQPHAAFYDAPPPDVTGRDVYVLDFSYDRATMEAMIAAAKSVTLIDHHKTALDRLAGLEAPNFHATIDMTRSGAYLTSLHFWPDREPVEMVQLVDDRDRWVFAKGDRTKLFHASLFSRPYKIGEWNRMCEDVDGEVAEGAAIDRKHHKDIAELLDLCTQPELIDLEAVPCANLPYIFASDAGAELLARFPEARFVATWFVNKDNVRVFSLRSRPGSDVDVAEIAQKFGGGGHKHASGFRIPVGVSAAVV